MIFFVGRVGNILQSLRSSASLVFVAWVKDFFLVLLSFFILSSTFLCISGASWGEKRGEVFDTLALRVTSY